MQKVVIESAELGRQGIRQSLNFQLVLYLFRCHLIKIRKITLHRHQTQQAEYDGTYQKQRDK